MDIEPRWKKEDRFTTSGFQGLVDIGGNPGAAGYGSQNRRFQNPEIAIPPPNFHCRNPWLHFGPILNSQHLKIIEGVNELTVLVEKTSAFLEHCNGVIGAGDNRERGPLGEYLHLHHHVAGGNYVQFYAIRCKFGTHPLKSVSSIRKQLQDPHYVVEILVAVPPFTHPVEVELENFRIEPFSIGDTHKRPRVILAGRPGYLSSVLTRVGGRPNRTMQLHRDTPLWDTCDSITPRR